MILEVSPTLLSSVSLVALYLGAILLIAETVNRLTDTHGELTRKIVHIGSGHVLLFAWWLEIPAWVGMAAAAIASIIALTSYFLPILPSINSVGIRSLGTFFYALSIGILVAIFWPLQHPECAVIVILVMAWGDGLAALVGQNFGKHPLSNRWNAKKLGRFSNHDDSKFLGNSLNSWVSTGFTLADHSDRDRRFPGCNCVRIFFKVWH